MELCICRGISNLPRHRLFSTNASRLHSKASLPLNKIYFSHKNPGLLYFSTPSLSATASEETSTSITEQFEEVPDGVITAEETPANEQNAPYEALSKEVPNEEAFMGEQMQVFEFLDRLKEKLDSEDTYSILVYGSSSLIALWLVSAIIGAIDSIPVFPKVLEIVGLAFAIWFSSRYLIFKKNRDELLAKIEELKQEIIGPTDD